MADDATTTSDDSTADDAIAAMLAEGGNVQDSAASSDDTAEEKLLTQAEFQKALDERLNRERAKAAAETKELRAKAAKADRLERERMSEAERLVAEARADERSVVLREQATKVVDAHIDLLVKGGQVNQEAAEDFLAVVDRNAFITPDGDVDTDRIAAVIKRLAGPPKAVEKSGFPDLGQGRRSSTETSTGDQFASAVKGFFR